MPDPHRCIGEPPRAGGGEHVASRSDRDPPVCAGICRSVSASQYAQITSI
jgi:hypothetical protein